MNRIMGIGFWQRFSPFSVLLLFLMMLVSLYLLNNATENSATIAPYYSWLLLGNAIGLLIFTTLLGYQAYRLFLEYRQHRAGIRLTLRMVTMFIILSIVPVTLVYVLSVQFLQKGIDSWFDVRIESALNDAIDLSRQAMASRIREKAKTTLTMAKALADRPTSLATLDLVDLRLSSSADEIALLDMTGRIYAFSSIDPQMSMPHLPSELIYSQLRQGYPYLNMEMVAGKFFIRVVMTIPDTAIPQVIREKRLIQVLYPVAERFNTLVQSVQSASGTYKELAYIRDELKDSFVLTLSLALAINILVATVVAIMSARRLVEPIKILIDGTRSVAQGQYHIQLPITVKDELGQLIGSFNEMAHKVAKASEVARQGQIAAQEEHAYLQAILSHLSSGVVTLDTNNQIMTINPVAAKLLSAPVTGLIGFPLQQLIHHSEYLRPLVTCIEHNLIRHNGNWQEQVNLSAIHEQQTFMIHCATLPSDSGHRDEHIIMIDDITELVLAQRSATWAEIGRRLAHEIKNPLTPIQLSAERIRLKCLDSTQRDLNTVLNQATQTIIEQVKAMKEMINAFTQYSRPPELKLKPLAIYPLIKETLDMYQSETHDMDLRLQQQSTGIVLLADRDRLRQLIHNIIRNAIDALEHTDHPQLIITLQSQHTDHIQLLIEDNGPGVDKHIINNLFEPYMTTKRHGTGLGLPIMKKIVEEHGGTIRVENRSQGGARVSITLPCQANLSGPTK